MSKQKFTLTIANIETLKPAPASYDIKDTQVAGLVVRVNPGGSKTFCLYRKFRGRQVRYKIGRFPETTIHNARKSATALIARFDKGENPDIERQEALKEITFKELWDVYYVNHAVPNTKNPQANKKMMELHVFPQIANVKLTHVTTEMIKNIHRSIWMRKERSKDHAINYTHADRVITIVSAVFNYASVEGLFAGNNPCKGVKKNKHKSRDRFLSRSELKSFLECLNH